MHVCTPPQQRTMKIGELEFPAIEHVSLIESNKVSDAA
jgi:hypothetical protein